MDNRYSMLHLRGYLEYLYHPNVRVLLKKLSEIASGFCLVSSWCSVYLFHQFVFK